MAVEIKSASRYNAAILKGLRGLANLPHLARRILVYNGPRAFRTDDGIEVWPLDDLHQALETDQLWP